MALLSGRVVALVLFAIAGFAGTAADPTLEYQVKAAFLYNFAKFVEWPGTSGSPVVLGVLGKDPFGLILDETIAGKTVNGRPIVLTRFTGMEGLKRCHILFVSSSERARLPQIMETLGHAGVLTVSEMEGFTQAGGMIGFVMQDNKIHLEINAGAASRAGLRISSKLLNLATVVSSGSGS